MKIIDVLNLIANGKIGNGFSFEFDDEIWVVDTNISNIRSINKMWTETYDYKYFFEYYGLETLNQEVTNISKIDFTNIEVADYDKALDKSITIPLSEYNELLIYKGRYLENTENSNVKVKKM